MNYWGGARFSESGELGIIEKLLSEKENVVFFDVGANDGKFAVEVSSRLSPTAKIYCFEPLPSMYEKLAETTKKNKNTFNFNIGLGAKHETLTIYSTKDKEGLASLYRSTSGTDFTSSENIKITVIDGFLKENNISHITYLKIDVEGHELKVLEGAKNSLKDHKIDYIQFEFGENMINSRVFFRDFWNLLSENYKIYRILPEGIREIIYYSENQEIFHCVNFIAISKLIV